MEEGVLCLKWRDHRSTFLRMLSSVRKKGVFCDVTLVCEGKFYPVHQLVLSTCSEYFQQMFEVLSSGTSGSAGNTRTAGPLVVVLTGVSPRDLEALLEYMYAGEATILQGDLARFMKAAEGFKVHGLAEPPPPASPSSSRRESGEGTKRTLPQCEDSWERKRKKESGDHHKVLKGKEALPEIVSPAQLASVELAPETQRGMERDTATGTPGDLPGPVAPLSPPSRPQIKYEEIQVKEEPQNLEEVDEAKKEQGRWSHRQHQEQQALVLGEGAETAQLLGFCDPGLNYLAHTSGLGAVTDRGHSSHHHRNIHATAGWEAAGTSDNFPQLPSGHLRAASQRRMGRPTSEIWLHYTTERVAGRTAVYCRYCSQKYGYPNATKMKIHILKCTKCPEEVKHQFEITAKPELSEGQDVTLGAVSTDGGTAPKADPFPQYPAHQSQQATDRCTESTNTAVRSKSGSCRTEPGAENPSNSKAGFQNPGKSSHVKSQSTAQQEVPSGAEKASGTKPHVGQLSSQEKSAAAKTTDAKQRSFSSNTEKVKIPSRLQQQHSRPLSQSEERASLIPEPVCHNPVY
ncbi:uncharacterized protein LOC135106007 isoform X2 [Scylla paramamosain]